MNALEGKIVAVTGGGTGIGAGIALRLARAGCRVTIGGRRIEPLQAVAASLAAETATATAKESDPSAAGSIPNGSDTPMTVHPIGTVTVDVADASSIQGFFDRIRADVGDVDILVNSAGINIQNRTMATMDPEQWENVMNINANGAYRCMHQVLPAMRSKKDGLIVNISSVAGKRAISLGGVVYCASKFAMTALGTAVSNELRNEGVRVTNVYPGEVNTPILDNRPTPVSQDHKDAILQPEDIASVVLSICQLPPRANVPEIVIKPTIQEWV